MTLKTFYSIGNLNVFRDGTVENIYSGVRSRGCPRGNGYFQIMSDYQNLFVHRCVAEGFVPKLSALFNIVEHIKNNSDNSASNLRYVNQKLNAINNRCLGVVFRNGKWVAYFANKHLGTFSNSRDAILAHQKAKRQGFCDEWNRCTGLESQPSDHFMSFEYPPFSTVPKQSARDLKDRLENTKLGPFKNI